MKKNLFSRIAALTALACLLLALTACGSKTTTTEEDPADAGSTVEEQQPPTDSESTDSENAGSENTEGTDAEKAGLEALLGEDYQNYIVETITMQMDNRMQDMGDVEYYPIRDDAPLTDYVTIDENTSYELDEEGNVVILFPAGTVADESHGEQSFIVPVS